jgi:hypothetical protein
VLSMAGSMDRGPIDKQSEDYQQVRRAEPRENMSGACCERFSAVRKGCNHTSHHFEVEVPRARALLQLSPAPSCRPFLAAVTTAVKQKQHCQS